MNIANPSTGHVRVVHVINRFSSSGGAENQLLMNLTHFANVEIDHQVIVLYQEPNGLDPIPGSDLIYLFPPGERPSRRSILHRLRTALRQIQPDLVHCTLADAALAARVAGRLDGWKVLESLVNISHEAVRTVDNPSVKRWKLSAHRTVDRLTMQYVAHFHSLTNAVARSWISEVGIDPQKITVIPRGIDLTRFDLALAGETRTRLRAELGLEFDQPMILNVGRQEPQKGQRYLIEAMCHVREEIPDAVLVMAGRSGNSTEDLRELIARLGLEDAVIQLGVRDDVPDLLHASDVFAFPSLFEGLGVSLIEAMAARKPCIVSTAQPFPEIVDHGRTGMMVAPRDAGALANGISEVLTSRELGTRLGAAARATVESDYEISAIARRTESLYLELTAPENALG